MEGKFKAWHKILLGLSLLMLVGGSVIGVLITKDKGVVIVLSLVALMLFGILCVAARFPATWRMTGKEKQKIHDSNQYQIRYMNVFVIINVILNIVMVGLILMIPLPSRVPANKPSIYAGSGVRKAI